MVPEKKKAAKPQKAVEKKVPVEKAPVKHAAPAQAEGTEVRHRRMIVGVVVSDKMQKTIVIEVSRRVKHALYHKFVERAHRFKAHDEKNTAKIGDQVRVVESRPLSREKRWVLHSILRKAGQA